MTMIKINDPKKAEALQITANFSGKEFYCNHCKQLLIDENLVKKLQQLRDIYGTGIIITSGYRCPTHNARVGGSNQSLHKDGKAADFIMAGRHNAFQVFTEACKIFGRVGLYQSTNNPMSAYIHVDIGEKGTWWLSYPISSGGKIKRVYAYYKSLSNLAKAVQEDKQRDWLNMTI